MVPEVSVPAASSTSFGMEGGGTSQQGVYAGALRMARKEGEGLEGPL